MKKLVEIAKFTKKIDEMSAFYETMLGTTPAARSEGMAIFMIGDVKLFLHASYEPKDGELPPENHLAFEVPDVVQACNELAEAGLKIEVPPKEYYWGHSAYLRDPDGHMIELIEVDQAQSN
jgi:catechol 2,3-dioxygenase-like lactoylglutathione lyase family enzyme